ncbi:Rrf2 family transcriptional regulator [Brucella intermedia]|uniref:Rrf2 family transcriptional regulator n=1 Tax=Brucella intermedia TaxID=94625 RepID=UPI0034CE7EF1
MQMSMRSDNAIKILLYLAAQHEDRLVPVPELAFAVSISPFSMQTLINDLAQANLVRTTRGRNGGVKAVRDLANVRVSEVIAVGEQDAGWKFTECDRSPDCACFLNGRCSLRNMYRHVQEQIMVIFEGYSMAQLRSPETDAAARERAALFRNRPCPEKKDGMTRQPEVNAMP